jgi:tRNA1(Val) A37 N6-methylase TrmN6
MIINKIKKMIVGQFDLAFRLNQDNILSLLEINNTAKIFDSGCNDGVWTKKIAKQIESKKVYGIDFFKKSTAQATKNGEVLDISHLQHHMEIYIKYIATL